jgi:DNA-directed RNA polymerase subunit N (RpoN/RPB10)
MPETFDEFVKMIENDNLPEAALEELGGIKSCYLCGEGILIPYDAAEAVLDYYGNPDTDVELVSLFEELGGEYAHLVESVDFHGACQYCGYQMSKDD